jgi:hypothetical protein
MADECPTDYLASALPPAVMAALWLFSEVFPFIPSSIIASNGLLEMIVNTLAAFGRRGGHTVKASIADTYSANPALQSVIPESSPPVGDEELTNMTKDALLQEVRRLRSLPQFSNSLHESNNDIVVKVSEK